MASVSQVSGPVEDLDHTPDHVSSNLTLTDENPFLVRQSGWETTGKLGSPPIGSETVRISGVTCTTQDGTVAAVCSANEVWRKSTWINRLIQE